MIEQLNVSCAQWREMSPNAHRERVATVMLSGGTPMVIQPILNNYLRLTPDWRQTVDTTIALLDAHCAGQLALKPGGQVSPPAEEGTWVRVVGGHIADPTSVTVVRTAAAVTVGAIIGALGMHSWLKKKY